MVSVRAGDWEGWRPPGFSMVPIRTGGEGDCVYFSDGVFRIVGGCPGHSAE